MKTVKKKKGKEEHAYWQKKRFGKNLKEKTKKKDKKIRQKKKMNGKKETVKES